MQNRKNERGREGKMQHETVDSGAKADRIAIRNLNNKRNKVTYEGRAWPESVCLSERAFKGAITSVAVYRI